jgi:hypothetical protein
LTLGFLLFACGVLLCTSTAQILVADQVADGFFGRAQGLVPLARRAVLVVFCDCAGVGVGGDGADPGGGVRGIVLGFAFGFLDVTLGLRLLVGVAGCGLAVLGLLGWKSRRLQCPWHVGRDRWLGPGRTGQLKRFR